MSSWDDPFEQAMKSTIAEWFRDEKRRQLEQARSLAVKLEGENASLERALHEAEQEIERLNIALENTCKAYAETLLELQQADNE